MASSIIILKPINDYSTVETVKVFKRAVIDSGMIISNMDMEYDSNKIAIGAEGCIGFVHSDNNLKQFLFTINNIDEYSENSFEWLVPEKKLFWAIDIEDIGGYHRQVFDFATKYFCENLNDYLWLDSLKWVYSAKEIETLSRSPYSSKWLYEKLV